MKSKIILLSLGVAALSGCGAIKQPSADFSNTALSANNYLHSGTEQSCASCHGSERPSSTANFTSLNLNAPFDYSVHNAPMDCFFCHVIPNLRRTPSDWATGHYSHTNPVPGTCSTCHAPQRPSLTPSGAAHDATNDCGKCHLQSLATTFSNVATDWHTTQGAPHPTSGSTSGSTYDCSTCHGQGGTATPQLSVPTSSHYLGATTCIGCHSDYASFSSLSFDHQSNANSCQGCHTYSGGSYTTFTQAQTLSLTGNYTISISYRVTGIYSNDGNTLQFTQPHSNVAMNSCSDCHQYGSNGNGGNYGGVTNSVGNGGSSIWQFQHQANGETSGNGCLLCHVNGVPHDH